MPQWASRITLEVTDIRVDRVQRITEADAISEGVAPFFERFPYFARDQHILSGELAAEAPYRASFAVSWDEANADKLVGHRQIRWIDNPFVWVLTYRVVQPVIGSPS